MAEGHENFFLFFFFSPRLCVFVPTISVFDLGCTKLTSSHLDVSVLLTTGNLLHLSSASCLPAALHWKWNVLCAAASVEVSACLSLWAHLYNYQRYFPNTRLSKLTSADATHAPTDNFILLRFSTTVSFAQRANSAPLLPFSIAGRTFLPLCR